MAAAWSNSDYFLSLEEEDQKAYKSKLTLTTGEVLPDPDNYCVDSWENEVSLMPDITWGDMYNYLINSPSNITHE